MKSLKYIHLISTWVPFVWLALFLTFAIRATVQLGHLPFPSVNDPKDLGLDYHHALIWFLFLGLIYLIAPYWLVMTIIAKMKNLENFYVLRNSITFGAGSIAIFCMLYFDPYRLAEWFVD